MKSNKFRVNRILSLFIFMCSVIVLSAQSYDTSYENKIKEYTTDERFLPPMLAKMPLQKGIPSPLDHFGSIIGAPGVMHHSEEIYGYFRKLSEMSSKVKIEQIGISEEGRPINLITISSEKNIKNLKRYKDIMARLADPRNTDSKTAEKLIKEGKTIYFLNGAMHSGEMGSPEALMELSYRLIADKSEDYSNILENCIVLINPVSEPDGRDKQVDWYYRYTKDRKEYDDGFRRVAPYWGKYVYHDNNRDGLQISQEITKAIFKIYFDWHPNVMLDLHESVPLLYISTGTGPYNENIDPITVGEWQTIANHELTTFSAQGLPGVFEWAFYDGWWPGYGIWVANNHNSVGRFFETFGNAGANTYLRDISKAKFAGDLVTSREWYRPDPSTGKLYWSARNNINYTETGVLASLQYAANNKNMLLRNFYQKSVNGTNFSKINETKMFVISEEQRDPVMAAYLVNQLRRQGIEVHKVNNLKREYVILLDQPYSRFAYDLLTEQKYRADAKFPPYDAIAWTLGYMYGVDVQKYDSLKYSTDELSLVNENIVYSGKVTGDGSDFIINYKAQAPVLSGLYAAANQYNNFESEILDSVTIAGTDTLQTGSLILKGLTSKQANDWAEKYGIDLLAKNITGENSRSIQLPKIAVFHSWTNTQAEGWVRFTMEQKGIPFTSIDKDDLKNGKLKSRFDVIIIPHQGGDLSYFVNGLDDRFGPMPYTKTAEFPSHGYPDSTEDMTGGPGLDGLNNLKTFVRDGGVLVPLANSAAIIADAGIGKEVSSFSPGGLFHPGSLVSAKARNAKSPILYGYPDTFHLFKGNGKLLATEKYDRNLMVLQYGTKPLKDEVEYTGKILGQKKMEEKELNKTETEKSDTTEVKKEKEPKYVLSGMVKNEDAIVGQGAIFNVPLGKGNVVFFTFNPLNRYLNHHDSSLLWNVLINWDHL
ncbi:peptidase [Maribellus comscasis]|uniref:Peptidase n=1 Tax=Maribellus comscasis TaxID=2681766 RepID=A0A6I6JMJ5_9BACT|nr:M14 family zinc carboxypeptidase [Maribellus comscasis]QGY42190.1 peptidase [Maribellus comscasis]